MPGLSVIARRNKELIVVVFVGVLYTKELKLASLVKHENISYLVQTLGSTGVMISCTLPAWHMHLQALFV